jgi:hypothetical protein
MDIGEDRARMLSETCASDSHAACEHKLNSGYVLPDHLLNFRGTVLCQCDCHSHCSLALRNRISELTWLQSCTCAGAERRRAQDTAQRSEQAVGGDQHATVADAIDAVRANSAGKSQIEIEQLLKDELTACGIDYPEPLVQSAAAVIAHPSGILGQARMLRYGVRALANLVVQVGRLSKVFEGAEVIQDRSGTPQHFFMPGQATGWVDVLVDEPGRQILRAQARTRESEERDRDIVPLRLDYNGMRSSGPVVDVYIDRDHVGTLASEDGTRYLRAISAARARGGSLTTTGVLTVSEDGVRLRIATLSRL